MKNFSLILFALTAISFGTTFTGCGPDNDPVIITDTTTTGGNEDPVFANSLKVGFVQYDLTTVDDKTFGVYNTASNLTYISVFGNDADEGDADFNIEIPGTDTGTFTTHNAGGGVFECGTGTEGDIKRQEYSADNSEFTIKVTEYGAVGEKIKGTFSGKVKRGTNSIDVPKGKFEVTRSPNEG
ncbi:MAG: hypothetical protein COA58_02405 [Bacteroidetes bacterium]|nr:MAG: hypothetical protein COA58_02405 [Bacteroidota bacterium]